MTYTGYNNCPNAPRHEFHKPRPNSTIKICVWCEQFRHVTTRKEKIERVDLTDNITIVSIS